MTLQMFIKSKIVIYTKYFRSTITLMYTPLMCQEIYSKVAEKENHKTK